MLNAHRLCSFQYFGDIYLPGAQCHVVFGVGAACKVVGNAFPDVFQVYQFPAAFVFLKQLCRVSTTMKRPQHIHFKRYIFGHGVLGDIIE
jgi:hypothetical protein